MNRRQMLIGATAAVVAPVLPPEVLTSVEPSLTKPFLIDRTGAFLVGKLERLDVEMLSWKVSWTVGLGETLGSASSLKRVWVGLAQS